MLAFTWNDLVIVGILALLVGVLLGGAWRTVFFVASFCVGLVIAAILWPFASRPRRNPKNTAIKLFALAAVALLVAPISGCGTVAKVIGPAPILSPAAQLQVAKGEYDFEAICNLAAKAFLAIEPNLSPADKATGKGLAADLHDALIAARNAEAVGDALGFSARLAAIQRLSAQLYTFVAAHTPPAAPAAAAS